MKPIAWVLVIVGSIVLLGYGIYYSVDEFFTDPDVPIAVKIATPAVLVGLVLLLAAVFKDRIKERGKEQFRRVDR